MKSAFYAAVVAATLGAAPAQAMGPVSGDSIAPASPITSVMTAARARRLYMIQSLQRQQQRGYGGGYGHRGGYGGGYGGRGYGGGGRGYGGPGYYQPRQRW